MRLLALVAALVLFGCGSPAPLDPDPTVAQNDVSLAEEYATLVLKDTTEDELRDLCRVAREFDREYLRREFILAYAKNITDDHIAPDVAFDAYYERLLVVCAFRGGFA